MGMYDELTFQCPHCNETIIEQSKMGECALSTYTLNNAPLLIIADINDEGENNRLYCEHCSTKLELEVKFIVTPKIKIDQEDEYLNDYRAV